MEQDIAQSDNQPSIEPAQAPAENLVPQQRLDEVTAARREAERQRDELQQKVLELSMKQAEQAALQQAAIYQRQAAPPVDVLAPLRERDPELARILEAQQAQQAQQYKQQLAAIEAHAKNLELQVEVSKIPNVPAEVQAKAGQYLQRWLGAGVPVTAEDALKFALGEHAAAQLRRTAGVQGVTPPPTPVLTQANSPVPSTSQAAGRLPANFNQLSRQQQEAIEDQLYGDLPL